MTTERSLSGLLLLLSSCVAIARFAASPPQAAVPPCLDLVHASASELEQLPRVGPALARRIVQWRNENANKIKTLGDFDAVPGLGPASLEKLRPFLCADVTSP